MSLDGLEAQLAAAWSDENLAVYADALQAAGDPRGELIAFELHADVAGNTMDVDVRCKQLAFEWLGDLAGDPAVSWRYGFLDIAVDDTTRGETFARVLGGPHGRLVRALRVASQTPRRIRRVIELAAAAVRPWLTRLEIDHQGRPSEVVIGGALAAAVVAATPRLHTLHVRGPGALVGLVHPALRRARVTGWDAMSALARTGSPHPALVELDLQIGGAGSYRPSATQLDELMHVDRLPALRQLDMSRTESTVQLRERGATPELFLFLARKPVTRQLTHLRVPPVEGYGTRDRMQTMLNAMPDLRELQIGVQGSGGGVLLPLHQTLRHPTARIVTVQLGNVSIGSHATIVVQAHGQELVLEPLVRMMLAGYARLTPEARRAWEQMYGFLEQLVDEDPGTGIELALPTVVVAAVLEAALALRGKLDDDVGWPRLAAQLRAPGAPATVAIERFWANTARGPEPEPEAVPPQPYCVDCGAEVADPRWCPECGYVEP